MNTKDREIATLDFNKNKDRGSVQETFYPWDLTMFEFAKQGLPQKYLESITYLNPKICGTKRDNFLCSSWANGVMEYEEYLGFDNLLRVGIVLPIRYNTAEIMGKPYLETNADFDKLLKYSKTIESDFFSDADFEEVFGKYTQGHQKGDYSIRINIDGFFFAPRELFGIEDHLYAFYDKPDLLHKVNEYILDFYLKYLVKLLNMLPANVIYFQEDLSGKNGPMISSAMFHEFLGNYYEKLFPSLKKAGAKYIFVDTDGDFNSLISDFIKTGVDGFLPMDVNAGMDINKVRATYPNLRFIGGYNKLEISKGKKAIDAEFERILPVIKQGGYIPGCDHQLQPDASLENYKYYITKLKQIMNDI